jgi:hypothetical protein
MVTLAMGELQLENHRQTIRAMGRDDNRDVRAWVGPAETKPPPVDAVIEE